MHFQLPIISGFSRKFLRFRVAYHCTRWVELERLGEECISEGEILRLTKFMIISNETFIVIFKMKENFTQNFENKRFQKLWK